MTTRPAKTFAVICHFRQPQLLASTVSALRNQTQPPSSILIADNSEGVDDAGSMSLRSDERVLRLPYNRGYGAAVNAGVQALSQDLGPDDRLLILSHESLLGPGSLAALNAAIERPGIGLVAPLFADLRHPGRVWSAGGRFDQAGRPQHIGAGDQVTSWIGRGLQDVLWCDGATMLLRAAIFRQLGGFDERFFMYYEEVDFCARVRAAGARVAVVCSALAQQQPGTTQTTRLMERNRLLYVERAYGRRAAGRQVVQALLARPRRPARELLGTADYVLRRFGKPGPAQP